MFLTESRLPKRALVLSGGGSKGAWQVGAIKALLGAGKRSWDSVHGISVGALNASFLSMYNPEEQHEHIEKLVDLWLGIKNSNDIYKPWLPYKLPNYLMSMFKGSINSGAPLETLFDSMWNIESCSSSRTTLTVGCTSFTTGRYCVFDNSHPEIKKFILASSHLPIVFPPISVDGEQWVDGGIRYQIPLLEAIKEKPQIIDVVLTAPITTDLDILSDDLVSAPKCAVRASEILSEQIYINDFYAVIRAKLNHEKEVSDIISEHRKTRTYKKYKEDLSEQELLTMCSCPKINLYVPKPSFQAYHSMFFEPQTIKTSILKGFEETENVIKKEMKENNNF